MLYLLCIVKS